MIRNTYAPLDRSYFITLTRTGRGRTLRQYALISSGSRREQCEFGRTDDRATGGRRGWWLTLSAVDGKNQCTYGATRMEAAINMAELLRRQWHPITAA